MTCRRSTTRRWRSSDGGSRASRSCATPMLVSGVVAGIAAGIAFGGEWRRLNSFTLQLWPLLVVGAGLRFVGDVVPSSPLGVYFFGLVCVAVVAARNWRLPGAALISVDTFSDVLAVTLNDGVPSALACGPAC